MTKSFKKPAVATSALLAGLMSVLPVAAADQPRQGGTLIYLDKQVHTNLYPPAGTSYTSAGILSQIADRLTWQNPKTLEIEPWLAESWEVNDNATVYTFHLRAGVTFSDGTPLNAAAVAKNFDTYGLGNAALRQPVAEVINNYQRSEVVDPLTVRFYFKRPSPGFLQATSVINSGIVSLQTIALPFDRMGDATKIIGSGPFVVKSETLGRELVLTARKDYQWGPKNFPHQGRAYLDTLRLLTVPEDNIRIGALIAGQAHFIRHLEAYDEDRVTKAGKIIYTVGTGGINNNVVFRPDNPLVADIRVRQALLYATNRDDIIRTLYSKRYKPATSVIAHNAAGYIDQSAKLNFDLEKAHKLLDEAGWKTGADSLRHKDGKTLELTAYESIHQPQNKAMLQLLSRQWQQNVGIKLNVKTWDATNAVLDNLDPAKTPVAPSMVGRADPDVLKSNFHPQNRDNIRQKGGLSDKVQSFYDSKLNTLLENIASEPDRSKRLQELGQAMEYLVDQAYIIPIFEEPLVYGGAPNVKGIAFEAVGRPVFYSAWIDQ